MELHIKLVLRPSTKVRNSCQPIIVSAQEGGFCLAQLVYFIDSSLNPPLPVFVCYVFFFSLPSRPSADARLRLKRLRGSIISDSETQFLSVRFFSIALRR